MCESGLLWKFDAPDAATALGARESMLATLREHRDWEVDQEAAKSAYTELLSNVLRYGGCPVEVWLFCQDDEVKLHVLEFGLGFDEEPRLPSPMSEHGRGLFLVSHLAADLRINGDPRGTHIIATLPRKEQSPSRN